MEPQFLPCDKGMVTKFFAVRKLEPETPDKGDEGDDL